ALPRRRGPRPSTPDDLRPLHQQPVRRGRSALGGLMARASLREIAPWLGLAGLAFALDQLTKWLILANFALGDSVTITSFFNVVRVHNEGAAFSFLAGAGGWQRWFFTAIGIAASVFIVWMLRSHPGQRLFAFSLAC